MKKKNLLLWGYYGANNFGDDLIFDALVKILKQGKSDYNLFYTIKSEDYQYDINAKPLVFFNKKHANKAINFLLNIWFVFKTVIKMDVIIIGGGTQYFELNTRKSISIPIKYLACSIMKLSGKVFINAGVGIGEVKSKIGKFCLKGIFKKANYSFVRDIKSKSFLEEIGVPQQKIILGQDMSYYLPLPNNNSAPSSSLKIGLNFFDYFNYIAKDELKNQEFIKDIEAFVHWLITSKNCEPHFFAFQKEAGGKDFLFMKEHFSKFKSPIHLYENNIQEFVHLIGSMDINVGMRYHFAVLSLQHQIPFIGLNYQPKVKRELDYYGLKNLCIEMNETNLLPKKFDVLFNEYEDYKTDLKSKIKNTSNSKNNSIIDQLLKAING